MNIEYKDGNVIITVPYKQGEKYPESGTGKSRMIGTTSGFAAVPGAPDNVKLSFNLIEVIPKKERK